MGQITAMVYFYVDSGHMVSSMAVVIPNRHCSQCVAKCIDYNLNCVLRCTGLAEGSVFGGLTLPSSL